MLDIKRYYPSDVRLQAGATLVAFTEHSFGQLCLHKEIAPIIQELREELARLHEKAPTKMPVGLIEWVRMQRNDIPATGEEFANAIEVWLEDKMK
jgi:hypothetical protein